MKLNIGCGYDYLKGYCNIDSSRASLADRLMQAHSLAFDSCSAEEIVAKQLIEHLGYFKGIYFLSECFRVLKPGGVLRLETPHFEQSIERFLKGSRNGRESVIIWLYGAETDNMQHKFCFPSDLLVSLSRMTGFRVLKQETFMYEKHRPAIRLLLKKTGRVARLQFMAELRNRLVLKGIPDFSNECVISEQEKLLKKLAVMHKADYRHILDMAVCSAGIVNEFFGLIMLEDPAAQKYSAAARYLSGKGFQAVLLNKLIENRAGAGRQKEALEQTYRQGRLIISALLAGKKARMPVPVKSEIVILSDPVLKDISGKLFAAGLKEFRLANYDRALLLFAGAASIFRDDPFVYWNMASAEIMKHNRKRAMSNYEKALAAFEACACNSARKQLKEFRSEMAEYRIK